MHESNASDGTRWNAKRDHDRRQESARPKPADQGPERRDEDDKSNDPETPPPYKRPAVLISIGVVGLIAVVAGVIYWLHARHFVSTDDAYIDGHVTQTAAQVSAPVLALHIDDNQFVHKGDLLVELDPTDYQVALEQAEAQAASARGRLAQAQAQIESAKAAVTQASAEVQAAARPTRAIGSDTGDRSRHAL